MPTVSVLETHWDIHSPLLHYSHSPLIHHIHLLMAYSLVSDTCMVAWLLSNQKNSGTAQNGCLYKVVTLRTYVCTTQPMRWQLCKHMHEYLCSQVIGPQGIPVQGANKAGKSPMRHIISDFCHGDFHLQSYIATHICQQDRWADRTAAQKKCNETHY